MPSRRVKEIVALASVIYLFFFASRIGFTCPNLSRSRSFRIWRPSACSTLKCLDTRFSIKFCSRGCNTFTVTISRLDECLEKSIPDLSQNEELNKIILQSGPDAFLLQTDGAERYSSERPIYRGNCSYHFDFTLANAGPVSIQLYLMYENFDAWRDTSKEWPDLKAKPLLRDGVHLPTCSHQCRPIQREPDRARHQPCSDVVPNDGFYISKASILDIGPLYHSSLRKYIYVQYCSQPIAGLLGQNQAPFLEQDKRVMVVGDSHTRVILDSLLYRWRGHTDINTESAKIEQKADRVGNVEFFYEWATFPGNVTNIVANCTIFHNLHALYIGITHHIVANKHTETFGAIAELVRALRYVASLRDSCHAPTRLIFLTGPADTPRDDEFRRYYSDHRTNRRLEYWRDRLLPEALSLGYAVVDQFAISHPMLWQPGYHDKMHYLASDALDPIVDEFILKGRLF